MEEKLYKQKTVREVTGMSQPVLDSWLKAGFIVPASVPRRRGHHAGYSVENIVQIKILDMLADAGLSLRNASAISLLIEAPYVADMIFVGLDDPDHPKLYVDETPPPDTLAIMLRPVHIYEAVQDKLEL